MAQWREWDWASPAIFTSGHPWPESARFFCCPWSSLSSAATGTEGVFANVPGPLSSPDLQRNSCKMAPLGSHNYYMTSEISHKRPGPPFSEFPAGLYIVLCIVLVGVGWGQFLFLYEFSLTQNILVCTQWGKDQTVTPEIIPVSGSV